MKVSKIEAFREAERHLYLLPPEGTLNSRRRKIKCTKCWPCKRMQCSDCRNRRRRFFIDCGLFHVLDKGLTTFVTASWAKPEYADLWLRLLQWSGVLSKTLSGIKAGPYIRVICLGKRDDCPHVHYLANDLTATLIREVSHKKWSGKVKVQTEVSYDIEGVLGYLFDQNFIPAQLDQRRPKGSRVLTASRPMAYGFPSYKQERTLRERHNANHGKQSLEHKINWNGNESSSHHGAAT